MVLILPPDIYDTPSHDSMTHPCSRQTFWRNMSAVGHNVVQCLTSKDVAIHGGWFLTKLMYSDLNSNNSCRGDFFETEELWECEMLRDIWIKSRKIIIVPHPSHPAHHLARIHILKMRNPINVRQEQGFWGNIVNIQCRFSCFLNILPDILCFRCVCPYISRKLNPRTWVQQSLRGCVRNWYLWVQEREWKRRNDFLHKFIPLKYDI